jgi:ABC-type phosphate transport system auxiliary subunit
MPNIFILHTLQTIMGNKEKSMTITQELIEKYRAYSDAELMTTNTHIDGYSNEAKEAVSKVLIEKGGLESLQKRIAEQDAINNEMLSIKHEIIELLNQGLDAFEIKTQINSTLISSIEIDLIIKETTTNYNF